MGQWQFIEYRYMHVYEIIKFNIKGVGSKRKASSLHDKYIAQTLHYMLLHR